jgi:hypothetical protein
VRPASIGGRGPVRAMIRPDSVEATISSAASGNALNRRIAEAVAVLDYASVAALSADALKNAEDARPSWSTTPSGQTMGQHFARLDAEGRRAYIAEGRRVLA